MGTYLTDWVLFCGSLYHLTWVARAIASYRFAGNSYADYSGTTLLLNGYDEEMSFGDGGRRASLLQ